MSEDQDRGSRDFSRYDSMTTEDLEEILRLDAEAPMEQESDTELILYVMEVLASRRNTNNTGKTAQESWESFQKNYLSDEQGSQAGKKSKSNRPWLRRLIAAAAAVALVVCIPLTAHAFGWKDIWNVVARWAKETFSFVSSEDATVDAPNPISEEGFTSLQDALEKSNRDSSIVPTWIPDGFQLKKIEKDITPAQEIYRAYYIDGFKELMIRVQTYISTDSQNVEIEKNPIEVFESSGIKYYIFSNINQVQVIWSNGLYECIISGDLSIEEVKMMINSIGKG